MNIKMNDSRIQTIEQIEQLLKSNSLDFKIESKQEAYRWVQDKLVQFTYVTLSRRDKGILRRYLQIITGYSKSQITRLIGRYKQQGYVRPRQYIRYQPNKVYTDEDISLLAHTDELHNYPNGKSLKVTLEREYKLFHKQEYANIANVSVAHIYNLRKTTAYKRITKNYQSTQPTIVRIGERKQPQPNGKPGYLRVDTVHQGDQAGDKGLYHINTVDEITQFEAIGAVEKITDEYLVPLVHDLIEQYPFILLGFHADNGSEYINKQLAALLNSLFIELTKSRPRRSNDNALIESKNGSVIRKFMGYLHIEQKWAAQVNEFYHNLFNDYLNYHRPCAYATNIISSKGKIKKVYKLEDYMTPYEKLKSIRHAAQYLKPGVTFVQLDQKAHVCSDNEFAQIMMDARKKLFHKIWLPNPHVRHL